ncbi:hypothetical protein VTP01DRAFT_10382 [Rhizomucor pusillus]|uniref:uncharacterized protein n=1 Tax=Rhizomucor pusillus TaxID=4840 RepID=UPI0037429770
MTSPGLACTSVFADSQDLDLLPVLTTLIRSIEPASTGRRRWKFAVEDSGKVERNVSGDALLVGECTEIADASVLYSIKGGGAQRPHHRKYCG